jgi:hypothetical protein
LLGVPCKSILFDSVLPNLQNGMTTNVSDLVILFHLFFQGRFA